MKKQCIALMLGLLFLGIGCTKHGPSPYPQPATNATDGAFVAVTDSISMGNDKYAVDYGRLSVAENRSNPDSRLIHLPVMRIRTSSEHPLEPVFYFAGGPGRTNMAHPGAMWYLMPTHDVVLVGFRGVDGESALHCPTVAKAMKGDGSKRLFSASSMQNIADAWSKDFKALSDAGVDLDCYTMVDVVEDMQDARRALGYEKINLKSASYGTRVAQTYSYLHPESINRSAMVAVNPPGRFVWEPDVIDRQLRYYSDLWAQDPVASAKTADLYKTMTGVLNDMPDRWLLFPIDEDKVKCVAFSLCFQNKTAAMVFDAFVAASQGNASGLALMSMAYDFVIPGMFTWGDLATKAVSADYEPERDYITEMQPPAYPLGAPMSVLLWGPLDIEPIPIKSIPDSLKQPHYTDVPTLLVSGSNDLGTPTKFATNDLLPFLNNGRQVIIGECGHMDLEWGQPGNFQRMITSFYETGVPDTSLNKYVPMDFTVTWGFPRIAMTALSGIALVILLLALVVFLVTKVVQKIRNNK